MSRYKLNETVTTRTNEYGEVISETVSKSWKVEKDSEPFFLTYVKAISWMYNIKSVSTIHVLYKLLEVSEFNTNAVNVTTKVRADICEFLGISNVTFSKCIKQLVEAKILSGEKGTYIIDESVFWKGDYKTRQKLLASKATVIVKPDGSFDLKAED